MKNERKYYYYFVGAIVAVLLFVGANLDKTANNVKDATNNSSYYQQLEELNELLD